MAMNECDRCGDGYTVKPWLPFGLDLTCLCDDCKSERSDARSNAIARFERANIRKIDCPQCDGERHIGKSGSRRLECDECNGVGTVRVSPSPFKPFKIGLPLELRDFPFELKDEVKSYLPSDYYKK